MLKELWTFHIISGDFYEAYHLYQDEMRAVCGRFRSFYCELVN